MSEIEKLRTLADKLANYSGTTEYWDHLNDRGSLDRLFAITALSSWNSRRVSPTTNEEYLAMASEINTTLKPMLELTGDMSLYYDNLPKIYDHGLTDSDSTQFDFTEDADLIDLVYSAYWKSESLNVDTKSLASLNVFLKELTKFPDMSAICENKEKAANFYALAELQKRAKETTVITDIDTLVESGASGQPLTSEKFPTKELAALLLCKDLIVRKHWGDWYTRLEKLCDGIGNTSNLRDIEINEKSVYQAKEDVDHFILALSVTCSNQITYPPIPTNIGEYKLGDATLTLPDLAAYCAELITRYIDSDSSVSGELVLSIKENLALGELAQLSNLSKLLGLSVYDGVASVGNFVGGESFVSVRELKDMWLYIDKNSGELK